MAQRSPPSLHQAPLRLLWGINQTDPQDRTIRTRLVSVGEYIVIVPASSARCYSVTDDEALQRDELQLAQDKIESLDIWPAG